MHTIKPTAYNPHINKETISIKKIPTLYNPTFKIKIIKQRQKIQFCIIENYKKQTNVEM